MPSAGQPDFPPSVILDTTNFCNARCPFCPLFVGDDQIDREVRPAKIMDMALYEKILDEIAAWPVKPSTITHSANGEFYQDRLAIPRLEALARRGLGPITVLLTNGQFMDEKASRATLEAGVLRVIFGFDGASKEVYEQHRVRCDYDRVLDNLRRFVALRKEMGGNTTIELKFVRTMRNAHEVQMAYEMFGEILDREVDTFHDAMAVDWAESSITKIGGLYVYEKQLSNRRKSKCDYLNGGIMIQPDGKVPACGWDYNLKISDGGFGSAVDQTLRQIWHGASRRNLIEEIANENGDPPGTCKSCVILADVPPIGRDMCIIDESLLVTQGPSSFIYRFPSRAA